MNKTNNYGETPSLIAAIYGRLDTLKLLVSHGALFETGDINGETPRDVAGTGVY